MECISHRSACRGLLSAQTSAPHAPRLHVTLSTRALSTCPTSTMFSYTVVSLPTATELSSENLSCLDWDFSPEAARFRLFDLPQARPCNRTHAKIPGILAIRQTQTHEPHANYCIACLDSSSAASLTLVPMVCSLQASTKSSLAAMYWPGLLGTHLGSISM